MAKTKVLISFAVTAKLICVFVFAYANCWFSHGKAHFLNAHVTQYMYKQVSSSVIKFLINQKQDLRLLPNQNLGYLLVFLARLHQVHRAIVVTSVVRVYVYVYVRVTLSVKVF